MAGASYQLVMRAGPTPGKVFPLLKDEVLVGRDLTCDVVINDSEISRKHARLVMQAGSYVLEDLGSTNGTSVGGQRLLGPYILRQGEVITFGEHITLVFEGVQVDSDATVASIGTRPAVFTEPPVTPPVMEPVQPFAGQIPQGPEEIEPEPPKKKFPTWALIVIIVVVLCCLCLVVGGLLYRFAPEIPFIQDLFNSLGFSIS